MEERTLHLKIKVKALAAEARIIRQESRKTSGDIKYELNGHRTQIVRPLARLNLLAYGLLRGIPYDVMEKKCAEKPNFDRVVKTARNFGASTKQCEDWVEAAGNYLRVGTHAGEDAA